MKYLDLTGLQKLWTKIKTHVQTSLEGYAKKTDLFSKNYNDLTNKPTIPTDYTVITLSADSGTLTADQLAKLKANPHKVVFARSGFYYFAENLSSSSTWYYSCNVYYSGSNIIKRVLTITTASGAYTKTDYTYTPPTYTHPSEHPASMITGLATVATSGSYNDLTDKPTIPSGESSTQTPSEGLTYTLSEDGNSYIVSGIGTCTDTDIIIPSTYNGKPVTSIGEGALKQRYSLTSVVIPDSVTTIGEDAIKDCTILTRVVIGNSVTSIGESAFQNCPKLIDINIPDTVTSIGNYAFSGCSSLTRIVISANVTFIDYYAFNNCTNLTIYCEATEKPSEWLSNWNNSNCPVVWGVTMDILGLNAKFAEYLSGSNSPITDLGTQPSHKDAQQVMVDHIMQMNVENGCYLFKYYCPCYNNACLAVVLKSEEFVAGTVYDSFRSFRDFQYITTDEIYTLDGCWKNIASFDEELGGLETENKTVINAINELNAKVGSSGGGAGLSMPRIRVTGWGYEEIPVRNDVNGEINFTSGKIAFSVNVQDGTVQEGDELQVCAVRNVFGRKKLRPILSKTITAEDLENLTKQPFLQISTDDISGNNLAQTSNKAIKSFYHTDSEDFRKPKPKYVRIRRPIYKEGCEDPVNAIFSNVVPVEILLRFFEQV